MRWKAIFLTTFATLGLFICVSLAQQIHLNPPKGKPEEKLIIRGSGFRPEESIEILLKLSEHEIIGLGTAKADLVKTDNMGNFEVETAFPAFGKPGVYELIIFGDKGSQTKARLEILPK